MSSNEDIRQELDDVLLDDLLEVTDRMGGGDEGGAKITPGQNTHKEKRESVARDEIERISSELEISEATQDTAIALFNQYSEETDLAGNAIEVIAASCLYAACKVESVPLSPDDFASVPDTIYTRVILLRRVKTISSTLGLNPRAFFDPTHYIDRYCEELGLEEEVAERAHDIIAEADEAGIAGGKSPTGRAAAAVYNASMDVFCKVAQKEIAKVADVSEVTIRNRYRDQREVIDPIPETPELNADSSEEKSTDEPTSKPADSEEDSVEKDSSGEDEATDEPSSNHLTSEEEFVWMDVTTGPQSNSQSFRQETKEMNEYVGESVSEKVDTAFEQIDEPKEGLYDQCVNICRRIDESNIQAQVDYKDMALALAIIWYAGKENGTPIGFPTLWGTLEKRDDNIFSSSSKVGALLEESL